MFTHFQNMQSYHLIQNNSQRSLSFRFDNPTSIKEHHSSVVSSVSSSINNFSIFMEHAGLKLILPIQFDCRHGKHQRPCR